MKRSRSVVGVLVLCACCSLGAVPASADPNNNNSRKLRQAVTVEGILEHEAALQAIADAAAGNRLSGAPGYDDSADYVAARAAAAGFDVEVQEFEYDAGLPRRLRGAGPEHRGRHRVRRRHRRRRRSAVTSARCSSARPTASTSRRRCGRSISPCPAVGPPNTSTSGCEAADYAGVPAGAIIIVQRGTCTFAQKFSLADASPAGGDGVHQRGPARPDRAVVVQLRRHRDPDVRGDRRDGDGAGQRRAQR